MGSEQFGRGNVWASAKEGDKWTKIPFDRNNFLVSGTVLRIVESDVVSNKYFVKGDVVTWQLHINGDSEILSIVGNPTIRIKAPVKTYDPSCICTVIGSNINTSAAQPILITLFPENIIPNPSDTHAVIQTINPNTLNLGFWALSFTLIYGLK